MSWLLRLGGVLVVAGLQLSLFGHLRIFGVEPNLMLILVALTALWANATPALATAVGGGILMDLASGSDFGLRTAFLTAICLAIIAVKQLGAHTESLWAALAAITVGTLVFDLLVVASSGAGHIQAGYVASIIGRELVLNIVITTGVYLLRVLVIDRRQQVSNELQRGSWI